MSPLPLLHRVRTGIDYEPGEATYLFAARRDARLAHDYLVRNAGPGEWVDIDTIEVVPRNGYKAWRDEQEQGWVRD